MVLFYAYAKNILDDWSWRYVITFASYEVSNEWWSAVTNATGTSYPASVKRVNPQFYTHDTSKANIAYSITDSKVASQFLGLVFFTLLNDRDGRIQSIIPVFDFTDPISGNTFFIRSKVDPSLYWYSPDSTNADAHVYTSRTARTRFRVGKRNAQASQSTVMIQSDDVYISLPNDDRYVIVSGNSSLVVADKEEVFKFGDFTDGFVVKGEEIFKTQGGGEIWELV